MVVRRCGAIDAENAYAGGLLVGHVGVQQQRIGRVREAVRRRCVGAALRLGVPGVRPNGEVRIVHSQGNMMRDESGPTLSHIRRYPEHH
jgi:hypothetical protein